MVSVAVHAVDTVMLRPALSEKIAYIDIMLYQLVSSRFKGALYSIEFGVV